MTHLQDPAVAEAAAAKAAAQLLAEEDQEASKAAAKKAKKLRQKLAKKQQAQWDTAESTSAETLDTKDTVEAEAPVPQSPGQLANQLEALRLPTAPASADDSRNQSEEPTWLHLVADSQPPPLQPPVPSSSQDTTPKLHAAPQQSIVSEQPAPNVPMLDQSGGLAVHGSEQAAAQPPGLPGLQPDPDACFLHSLFCCPITQVGHQALQSTLCTCCLLHGDLIRCIVSSVDLRNDGTCLILLSCCRLLACFGHLQRC